ncbi:hypothetical protein D6745_01475 [Candidatus Woesearchaeota archaeon]|nr:MAG: hypothetical protein D6745_01475 [Candidatus Woesearchaeota archaeon]
MGEYPVMLNAFNFLNIRIGGFLSKLIVAVLIIFVGIIIGRLVGKLILRVLHELEINKSLRKATKIPISLEEIISNLSTYFIYFIAVVWALETLSLAPIILYILFGAFLLVIILSILLSIKDFIPNLIAGFILHKKRRLKIGDTIKVKHAEGRIVYLNLIETKVETKKGDEIFIPNSLLVKEKVVIIPNRRNKKSTTSH